MKWLLTILLLGSLYGQGFGYNYIDPCNQQAVNLNYKTETTENGFWVTYYNQRRFFTWLEVADGTLQNWTQQVYRDFEKLFPCAVNIAEEALASASTINLADELEREDEEDIGAAVFSPGDNLVRGAARSRRCVGRPARLACDRRKPKMATALREQSASAEPDPAEARIAA